jgi:hypothetical protein
MSPGQRAERSPTWLQRHPRALFAVCIVFVLVAAVALITDPGGTSEGRRSSVPNYVWAPLCIVLFGGGGIAALVRGRRRAGEDRGERRPSA